MAESTSTAQSNCSTPSFWGFILRFLGWLLVLGVLYAYTTVQFGEALNLLLELTATLSGMATSLFASEVVWSGKSVVCNGFPVRIISECTGLLEMVIFTSAVIGYLSTLRAKLIGLICGNILIYILNLVRIVVLLIVGSYSQSTFKFMHLYFWQATLVIMIALVWVAWLYLVVYREEKTVAVPS